MISGLIFNAWWRKFFAAIFARSTLDLAMVYRLVICTFFVISIFSSPVLGAKKSYDDIFKSVFGRVPEKQYFSQQMGLIIDHEYVADDIEVLVPSVGSDFKLFSYQILNYLHQNQKPGTVKDVTKKVDEDGMLTVQSLLDLGYGVVIDRRGFKINIQIPPEFRKKIIYYVMGEPEEELKVSAAQLIQPAGLSGYLNYSFSTNYLSSELDDTESGLEAPLGSFLGLVKTKSFSLNYAGSVDMSAMKKVNLGNLNLQYDAGEKNKRFILGQVSPLTKGVAGSMSLMGLGYTQGPVLNSIGNFSPEFTHELELDKDSQVDIYINYKKVRTLELPGGVYDLRGFPLRTGFNAIRIVKTTYYPVDSPKVESLVEDGQYNDINDGVLYKTDQKQSESKLEQSLRLHQTRQRSSEWLISQKIPRKGVQIEEDLPPPDRKVETEVYFPFAVDPVLYDPKYKELSYGVGYPLGWEGFRPIMSEQLTHSLYVKKGLNKFITSAPYLQVNDAHLLVGNEVYIATPFGPITADGALKQTKTIDKLGGYSRLSFLTYPIYNHPKSFFKLLSFGVSGSVRTPRFIPFGVARPVLHENLLLQYAVSLSYQLNYLFSGTFQLSETSSLLGNTEGDVWQFSSVFQRKLPYGFGVSAAYMKSIGEEVIEPQLITFKVTWSGFDGLATSTMYKQTVGTKDVQVDATYQKDFLDDKLATSTSFQNSLEKQSLSSALRYGRHSGTISMVNTALQSDQQFGYVLTNQRFNSNLGFINRQIEGVPVSVFSISGESALVFANTKFAISTPVQDSFVVFSGDKSVKGKTVFVGDEGRKIDRFGPTVLPALRDRVVTDVVVDIPSLSVGSEFKRLHSFQPINIQGYLVEMHVTPSVLLMAKLVSKKKRPMKYLRGHIVSPSNPDLKFKFITSRSGIFQVPNLNPGVYQLTFGKKPYESIDIEIPEDAEGLFKLGTQTVIKKKGGRSKSSAFADLMEQAKKKKEQKKAKVEDTSSKIDLLQQLIDDILSEKIDVAVEPTEQAEDKSVQPLTSVKPITQQRFVMPAMEGGTSETRSRLLHELKSEVNQFLLEANGQPTIKDSLAIAQKINDFYLREYKPVKPKNLLINDQVRTTTEQALYEHKKRRKVKTKKLKTVSSDAIDKALKQHEARKKINPRTSQP